MIAGPNGLLKRLASAGHHFRVEPRIPSLAYRLARVAEGALDAAIASTDACDWDIAAADILLEEAGARLTDLNNQVPRYNQTGTKHGVLLAGSDESRVALTEAARLALGPGPSR